MAWPKFNNRHKSKSLDYRFISGFIFFYGILLTFKIIWNKMTVIIVLQYETTVMANAATKILNHSIF